MLWHGCAGTGCLGRLTLVEGLLAEAVKPAAFAGGVT